MYTIEELRSKKKAEILQICKELNIQRYRGKKEITKEELISNIIERTDVKENEKENSSNVVKAVKELENKNKVYENLTDEERAIKKKSYIEDAKVGVLVAFKIGNEKVKSAKVVKKSTKHRKFKVETAYGAEYIISFDDILWVRTNKRWPKGVYQLLKGIKTDE